MRTNGARPSCSQIWGHGRSQSEGRDGGSERTNESMGISGPREGPAGLEELGRKILMVVNLLDGSQQSCNIALGQFYQSLALSILHSFVMHMFSELNDRIGVSRPSPTGWEGWRPAQNMRIHALIDHLGIPHNPPNENENYT